MNPVVGLDVVRTKLVTDIRLADGVVEIDMDLPVDHQFANNIREEIMEKVEPLWDVSRVDIAFTA